jgi:hypothetical protein
MRPVVGVDPGAKTTGIVLRHGNDLLGHWTVTNPLYPALPQDYLHTVIAVVAGAHAGETVGPVVPGFRDPLIAVEAVEPPHGHDFRGGDPSHRHRPRSPAWPVRLCPCRPWQERFARLAVLPAGTCRPPRTRPLLQRQGQTYAQRVGRGGQGAPVRRDAPVSPRWSTFLSNLLGTVLTACLLALIVVAAFAACRGLLT